MISESTRRQLIISESSYTSQINQPSPTSSLSRPSHYSLSQSQVKIKVLIRPNEEIRGFAIQTLKLDQEYLDMINIIRHDYGAVPSLTFIDSDGDTIQIKAKSDFLYAIESHLETYSNSNNECISKAIKLYALIPAIDEQYSIGSLPNSPKNQITNEINFTNKDTNTKLGQIGKSISHSNLITGRNSNGSQVSESSLGRSRNKSRKAVTSVRLTWQKGDIIGSGSFGQVYSGIDLTTGRKLAVKEVSLGHGSNHKLQVRALEQEIKILSQLDHPNIIKYFGAEVMEGEHMRFFLDYADEGSVKDILNHLGKHIIILL